MRRFNNLTVHYLAASKESDYRKHVGHGGYE
jgi:hypothetical protein